MLSPSSFSPIPLPRTWQGWLATLGGLGCRFPSGGLWAILLAFLFFQLVPVSPELFLALWIFGSYAVWRYVQKENPPEDGSPIVLDLFCGTWLATWGNQPGTALAGVLLFRVLTLIRPFPLFLLYPRWSGLGRMTASSLGGICAAVVVRGLVGLFLEDGMANVYQLFGG